ARLDGDNLVAAIEVKVGGAHLDFALEARVRAKVAEQRAIGAAERLDSAAVAVGHRDHIGSAIAVDVAAGDVHGAAEPRKREEVADQRSRLLTGDAAEDFDVAARRVFDDDQVRNSQVAAGRAQDVADRDANAALESSERLNVDAYLTGDGIQEAGRAPASRT